jgi:DNA-binding response OmpR family regulator
MDKNAYILLLEDEVITAMSLVMDLKKHGYTNSKFVATGRKALESVKEKSPDLLIVDESLSGGESGIEIAVEIRGKSNLPVIITSGYEIEDLDQKLNNLANSHFVQKPVVISGLIKLIEKL